MRRIVAAAFSLLLSGYAGGAVAAPTLSSHFSADATFLNFLSGNGVTLPANELFVAQARGGQPGARDYEVGLHIPPNFTNAGPVGTAGQINWGTGSAPGGNSFVAFSLGRSGSTITFAMGGYTGVYTAPANAALNALGFRARSESAGNSTEVRNIALDGTALPGASLLAKDGGLDFVVLSGLTGDFTVTGEAALNWANGAFPGGSSLGFQIKGIEGFTTVPEPATAALLLAGVGGLALARRRRRPALPAAA